MLKKNKNQSIKNTKSKFKILVIKVQDKTTLKMFILMKYVVVISFLFSIASATTNFSKKDKNFSQISKFACEVSKKVAHCHPETSAIAVITSENDFPKIFHDQLLNCLPQNIPKVVSTFKENIGEVFLTSSAFVIFIADKIDKVKL